MSDRKSYFFSPRLSDRDPLRDSYSKHRQEIEQFAEAGLYKPEMDELWRTLDQKVHTFVSAAEHRELLDRAARLLVHPMVFRVGFYKA
jgi:hypothetical protein